MSAAQRTILWNQFILAEAVARCAGQVAAGQVRSPQGDLPDADDGIAFSYTDTHAGCGRIAAPQPLLDAVLARRESFINRTFFDALGFDALGFDALGFDALGFDALGFDALGDPPARGLHPGSWVLAGRVVASLGDRRLEFEYDANDLDERLIKAARDNREGGWGRFWSHDWYQFLLARLAMARRPHFVFIDPPPDDARGPGYAMDAAILLDTLAVPYMVSYPADESPEEPINQIGRTGLELHWDGEGCGVLLGGGAEAALLHLLPDLTQLADLLGGTFLARLPRNDDYCI
jgi:hypothetical protein